LFHDESALLLDVKLSAASAANGALAVVISGLLFGEAALHLPYQCGKWHVHVAVDLAGLGSTLLRSISTAAVA
jgi:hypothetical protein